MNNFGAGLAVGVASLASGVAIGMTDPGKTPNFVQLVLIWIFEESLGLYGLIVALICLQHN